MRVEDLPKSAKRKLEKWRSLRSEEERQRGETQKRRSNNKPFKTKVGDSIKLLELELPFKVARTAGHFGMFCS